MAPTRTSPPAGPAASSTRRSSIGRSRNTAFLRRRVRATACARDGSAAPLSRKPGGRGLCALVSLPSRLAKRSQRGLKAGLDPELHDRADCRSPGAVRERPEPMTKPRRPLLLVSMKAGRLSTPSVRSPDTTADTSPGERCRVKRLSKVTGVNSSGSWRLTRQREPGRKLTVHGPRAGRAVGAVLISLSPHLTSRIRCHRGSLRWRSSKMGCQAARRKMAPAGAKGWLRVSMYQIASVSWRARSICATLGPRWRPRRRRVRW